MADLSRVRNAVRDCAEAMHRFERDFARMQREMESALAAGATRFDIDAIANQALQGKPKIRKKFADLVERLAAEGESDG